MTMTKDMFKDVDLGLPVQYCLKNTFLCVVEAVPSRRRAYSDSAQVRDSNGELHCSGNPLPLDAVTEDCKTPGECSSETSPAMTPMVPPVLSADLDESTPLQPDVEKDLFPTLRKADGTANLRGGEAHTMDEPAPQSRRARRSTRSTRRTTADPSRDDVTVMLRNIPNKYTPDKLLAELDAKGLRGHFDFLYLPIDFRNNCNLGYAFVNLVSAESGNTFTNTFQGQKLPGYRSNKVCEVALARVQGLQNNIERLRNSPVLLGLGSGYKPMLFRDGEQCPFPANDPPEAQQ